MEKIEGFKELPWTKAKEDQEVWIAGNLVKGKPTTVYGPHKVVNAKGQRLVGKRGVEFFECWHCVYIRK